MPVLQWDISVLLVRPAASSGRTGCSAALPGTWATGPGVLAHLPVPNGTLSQHVAVGIQVAMVHCHRVQIQPPVAEVRGLLDAADIDVQGGWAWPHAYQATRRLWPHPEWLAKCCGRTGLPDGWRRGTSRLYWPLGRVLGSSADTVFAAHQPQKSSNRAMYYWSRGWRPATSSHNLCRLTPAKVKVKLSVSVRVKLSVSASVCFGGGGGGGGVFVFISPPITFRKPADLVTWLTPQGAKIKGRSDAMAVWICNHTVKTVSAYLPWWGSPGWWVALTGWGSVECAQNSPPAKAVNKGYAAAVMDSEIICQWAWLLLILWTGDWQHPALIGWIPSDQSDACRQHWRLPIPTFGNRCLSAIGGGKQWSRLAGWVRLSAEAAPGPHGAPPAPPGRWEPYRWCGKFTWIAAL